MRSEESTKLCFLLLLIVIISSIFPKNFVEIYQVSQKIQIFTSSILTIFVNFMDFFNDVSIYKMISTAF